MARTVSKASSGNSSLAPWLGVALIVILFDQLTKIAIQKVFAYGVPHEVTPFFNLILVYNRGAAFSFLAMAGGWQRWAFTALGVVRTASRNRARSMSSLEASFESRRALR